MTAKFTETERQGNGRRYWFETRKAAKAFAAEKLAKGFAAIYEPDEDDDESPSVWVGPKGKASPETLGYLSGIDTASGYFGQGR